MLTATVGWSSNTDMGLFPDRWRPRFVPCSYSISNGIGTSSHGSLESLCTAPQLVQLDHVGAEFPSAGEKQVLIIDLVDP